MHKGERTDRGDDARLQRMPNKDLVPNNDKGSTWQKEYAPCGDTLCPQWALQH